MTLLKLATSALNFKVVQKQVRVNGVSDHDTVTSAAILTCKLSVTVRSACFPQVKRMIGGIGNMLFSFYFQTENV